MAKYKIRVEALDPAEEMRAEYRMGIECDSFCIMADLGNNDCKISVHDLNVVDIAYMLAGEDMMLEAAVLAKTMAEAKQLNRDRRGAKLAEMLMGGRRRDE